MDFRSKSARMVFVWRRRVYFVTFTLCNWPVECQNGNYSHCLWPFCTNLNICFCARTFCLSSVMDKTVTVSITLSVHVPILSTSSTLLPQYLYSLLFFVWLLCICLHIPTGLSRLEGVRGKAIVLTAWLH